MKTKEEILEEIFYRPETRDWYKPVLKAMEIYKQQFHPQITENYKEQLLNFAEWHCNEPFTREEHHDLSKRVERFLTL